MIEGLDLENIADGGQVALWVVAGAGIVVPRIVEPNRRQNLIWKFKVASGALPGIIIEPVEGASTTLYKRPSTGYGAVAAVAQLTNALNASRRGFVRRTTRSLEDPIEICFSTDQVAVDWCRHRSTVLVGGPKHNGLTRAVLTRYGCQPADAEQADPELLRQRTAALRVSDETASGLGVATCENTIHFFGRICDGSVRDHDHEDPDAKGFTGTDYGVVLRVPGLMDPRHRMIVVFGSQTFGIQAAASWLVNVKSGPTLRKTRNLLKKHRNIAALVKADVRDGIVGSPQLLEFLTLPDPLGTESH